MKKTIKFLGIAALIAVIGFSMASCGDKDSDGGIVVSATNGELTINDFPDGAVNAGYYIMGQSGDSSLYAADGFSGKKDDPTITGAYISSKNGIKLKVWQVNSDGELANYSGNDSNITFYFVIVNKKTLRYSEIPKYLFDEGLVQNITFTGGKGTGNFEDQ